MQTFAEIVRSRADDEHLGLRFGDEEWTWAQIVSESADRGAALCGSFAAPESRPLHVGVLLDNVPDYVFWLFAGALTGSVVVGINSSRRGSELAHDIRHSDCDVIISESRLIPLLDGVDHGVASAQVLNVDLPEYQDFLDPYRSAALPRDLPALESTYLLLFSSGSTGVPKAVIVSQGRMGALAQTLVGRVELTRDSVTYLCMPLFHGNSIMMNLAPATVLGATVTMARKFSASGFVNDIHRYGVTLVNYVGRALSYVLAVPEDPRDSASTLQLACGTEASQADAARFERRFGCRVSEGYGSSEGVLRIGRTRDTPAGALGMPVEGADVRVMNEDTGGECPVAELDAEGRLLNPAAVGQMVAVGAASRFEGYYKNPDAQLDRVRGDDFWTGDLAYRDQRGYFTFAGRSSDWLRVDSENFSAGPIERILQRFPGVSLALVYAVPDPQTGDQVMCALELEDGASFEPGAFSAFLDGQSDLGPKWRPRFVRVVEEMPLTANGKINKTPLRGAAWNTTDPVWRRQDRSSAYTLLDVRDRHLIDRELVDHGRSALLPPAMVGSLR